MINIALLIAAFVILTPGHGAADAKGDSRSPELNQLRDQVLTTFEKSVAACSVYMHGDPECVKKHFVQTYDWYVLGHQNFAIGPPGTPGPVVPKTGLSVDNSRQPYNQDQ